MFRFHAEILPEVGEIEFLLCSILSRQRIMGTCFSEYNQVSQQDGCLINEEVTQLVTTSRDRSEALSQMKDVMDHLIKTFRKDVSVSAMGTDGKYEVTFSNGDRAALVTHGEKVCGIFNQIEFRFRRSFVEDLLKPRS